MELQKSVIKIEITPKSVLVTILILFGIYLLFLLKDLFIDLFIAFIFMSALRPMVDLLEKNKIPRVIGAISLIVTVITSLTLFFYYALPIFIIETKDFLIFAYKQLVILLQQTNPKINASDLLPLNTVLQQIPNITNLVSKAIISLFSNLIHFLSLIFFTLYFLMGIGSLEKFLSKILKKDQAKTVLLTLSEIEKKLGSWVRGELILILIIGILSYIGLSVLGIKYALPLAVIAGLFEVFPIVGPILSAVPAFFVAGAISPIMALSIIALYILIQQLENNLIVPFVMKKSVGLSPLTTLVSLVIGQKLLGTVGAVLAVPLATSLLILAQEITKTKELTPEI